MRVRILSCVLLCSSSINTYTGCLSRLGVCCWQTSVTHTHTPLPGEIWQCLEIDCWSWPKVSYWHLIHTHTHTHIHTHTHTQVTFGNVYWHLIPRHPTHTHTHRGDIWQCQLASDTQTPHTPLPGNIWQCLEMHCLSRPGMCYCHLIGRGQGCC